MSAAFSLAPPSAPRSLPFGPDPEPSIELTEKYRPTTLSEVVGQGPAVWQLQGFVEFPTPRAFLFHGPTGVGKTSAAWGLAGDLGCPAFWGVYEIKSGMQDADAVESVLKAARYVVGGSGWKVVIVDEADLMTPKAAQVWLSALEDLPPKSVVVFTTNDLKRFPARFRDRCEVVEFSGDGTMLRQDAATLIRSVWAAETGSMDGAPEPDDIPGLVDGKGVISFRRAVQALEPLLRGRRSRRPAKGPGKSDGPPKRDEATEAPPARPKPVAGPVEAPATVALPKRKPRRPAPTAADIPALEREIAEMQDRFCELGEECRRLDREMTEAAKRLREARRAARAAGRKSWPPNP